MELVISGDTLDVTVHYCPAVRHIKNRGFMPHRSFAMSTDAVYDVIAKVSGLTFKMDFYDHDTGAAKFRFQ